MIMREILAPNFLEKFLEMETDDGAASSSEKPAAKFVSTDALRKAVVAVGKPIAPSMIATNEDLMKLPDEIEDTIMQIATTGKVHCSWEALKSALAHKARRSLASFGDQLKEDSNFADEYVVYFVRRLDLFPALPFTMQRLCELLHDPQHFYQKIKKFVTALDKCLSVTKTVSDAVGVAPAPTTAATDAPSSKEDLKPPTSGEGVTESGRKRKVNEISGGEQPGAP